MRGQHHGSSAGLLATGLLVCLLAGCATHPDLPRIDEVSPHGWGLTVSPGQVFTDAFIPLTLSGEGEVEITAVRFDGDAELELVGALLALPEHRLSGGIQVDETFPPQDPELGDPAEFREAIGFLMEAPEQPEHAVGDRMFGYGLLLGIRAPESGGHLRRAVVIDYLANGRPRSIRIPSELTVCVEMRVVDFECVAD